ncbi:MAG: peptide-methionine (S)-S-oxide reductase MsrA [Proteobacteria bacterium]|nr:peptide-methionine (S)-S-oxide reductase MsrA [Pseudomonadota bacterium]
MHVMLRRSLLGLLLLSIGLLPATPRAAEPAVMVPPPALDTPLKAGAGATETAVLAGGCFWGVQAVFQHVNGVGNAVSGYAGGTKETADYDIVSRGRSGHAEAVAITYDPSVISYGTILRIFFSVAHDPTQRDRQGPDVGPQYRSAIFAADDGQRRIAERYVAQLDEAGVFATPIATQLDGAKAFYPAEAYHQDYATLHPNEPYIVFNDRPKVENLKRLFPELRRDKPVLVGAPARPQG